MYITVQDDASKKTENEEEISGKKNKPKRGQVQLEA